MKPKYHPLRAYRSSPKSNRAKGSEDEKKTRLSSSSYPTSGKGEKHKLPDCLNPDCNQKHFVKDCKITSDEKKKTLLEAHRAQRRRRRTSKVQGSQLSWTGRPPLQGVHLSLQSRLHHRRVPQSWSTFMARTSRAASIRVLMISLSLTRLSSSWATMVTFSRPCSRK